VSLIGTIERPCLFKRDLDRIKIENRPDYEIYKTLEFWRDMCMICFPRSYSDKICSKCVQLHYREWMIPCNSFDLQYITCKYSDLLYVKHVSSLILDWYQGRIDEGYSKVEIFSHLQGFCMIEKFIKYVNRLIVHFTHFLKFFLLKSLEKTSGSSAFPRETNCFIFHKDDFQLILCLLNNNKISITTGQDRRIRIDRFLPFILEYKT
jgi:hypothetical protein